jgi:hypothetical protein
MKMDLTKYFKEPVCIKELQSAYIKELQSAYIPGVDIVVSNIRTEFDEKTNKMFYEQCALVNVDPNALIETGRLNMQLTKELEEAKSLIPNWTKVEDGLPKVNEHIIIFTDRGHKFSGYFSESEEWCCSDSLSKKSVVTFEKWIGKVTHWIPFPDDPVEEG